jgi:large subunit ribosomal protein L19
VFERDDVDDRRASLHWRPTMGVKPAIQRIEERYLKADRPDFRAGDTVRVHVRIREGEKERIQVFEGVVLARSGGSHRETFTVRKISSGVSVERVFPIHSPAIEKIEVVRIGRVRRAKLYYLRPLKGKAARIRTLRERRGGTAAKQAADAGADREE